MFGMIGMIGIVALCVQKFRYQKKIKELRRDNNDAYDNSIAAIIKKMKQRILLMNVSIAAIILLLVMTIVVVSITMLSFTSTMASMSGNTALTIFEESLAEKAKDVAGWVWDKTVPTKPVSSGGLYPKDPKLKLRAELLEILAKSVADAKASSGVSLEPAWMLGTIYRETGEDLYVNMDNTNISSLYKDLIPATPACTKPYCVYAANGISHYHGGTVAGGVDKGDPAKQIINTSESTYNSMGGDHAIGYIQFEIPYFYSHAKRVYSNTTPVITDSENESTLLSEVKMDTNLGFIRPNPFALTDSMYNGAFLIAQKPRISSGSYNSIMESSDFKSLSEYNQNFIKFMYSTCAYRRGSVASPDDPMANALISLAKSGKIEYLDDMALSQTDNFWDTSKMASKGDMGSIIKYIKSNYGIDIPSSNLGWSGVYDACNGKIAYVEMTKLIAAAEKEGGAPGGGTGGTGAAVGNWLDHPGSGAFGGTESKYYIPELGVRWYWQTGNLTSVNGSDWGKLPFCSSNMGNVGCGIYALANAISNLTNKDITPDLIYNLIYYPGGTWMSDDVVRKACEPYGLDWYRLEGVRTQSGMDKLVEEVKAGKMAEVWISGDSNFPWRTTPSGSNHHFILIKGVTADGKLLQITSTGHAGQSAEELMKIAVTPEQLMARMANPHAWIIGN